MCAAKAERQTDLTSRALRGRAGAATTMFPVAPVPTLHVNSVKLEFRTIGLEAMHHHRQRNRPAAGLTVEGHPLGSRRAAARADQGGALVDVEIEIVGPIGFTIE